jgi:hypothetical protein
LETRLSFYYICIEECSEDEWNCRWNILNLHDCVSRIDLLTAALSGSKDVDSLQAQAEELRERLNGNAHFLNLTPGARKAFLNGRKAHLIPLEEIAVRAGIALPLFQWMWKLMSTHTHSLPMSFYRMGNNERGRGVQTPVEEGYTKLLLSFSMTLLAASRDEFRLLMAGIDKG